MNASAEDLASAVRFGPNGLVVAIAQDVLSGEVRMVAFMNREAFVATIATGEAHFYSRSRAALWRKGESSGNVLAVRSVYLDCDGDALLLTVEPRGPTCHTGAPSCFSRVASPSGWSEGTRPVALAELLEATLESRRQGVGEQSYTRTLLEGGAELIASKLREEADELGDAVRAETDDRVVSEAADVVYHLMVGLLARRLPWRRVLAELARRFGTSGIDEKAHRERT